MRTRSRPLLFSLALFGCAQAFEPGSERICTPSADGQTFECREKSGAPDKPAAAGDAQAAPKPIAAAAAPIEPTAEPVSTAPATQASSATKLPNYLMQSPAASAPASAAETDTAQPERTRAPVNDAGKASSANVPADNPVKAESPAPAVPVRPSPQSGDAAQSRPVASEIATPDEPATQPESAGGNVPAPAQERSEPAPSVVAKPSPSPENTSTSAAAPRSLPGAEAFLGLPATDYTLVLASVRNRAALDALIPALDSLPGQLYLLTLDMPDGKWFSLCWADFKDLDSARAARASLPADPAITSGWPRRIGLLQKELAR